MQSHQDPFQSCRIIAGFKQYQADKNFCEGMNHLIVAQIVSKRYLKLLSENTKFAITTAKILVLIHKHIMLDPQMHRAFVERLRVNHSIDEILSALIRLDRVPHLFTEEKVLYLLTEKNAAAYVDHLLVVQRLIDKLHSHDWCCDVINEVQRNHSKILNQLPAALELIVAENINKNTVLSLAQDLEKKYLTTQSLSVNKPCSLYGMSHQHRTTEQCTRSVEYKI